MVTATPSWSPSATSSSGMKYRSNPSASATTSAIRPSSHALAVSAASRARTSSIVPT
jgi:hypothetical protein